MMPLTFLTPSPKTGPESTIHCVHDGTSERQSAVAADGAQAGLISAAGSFLRCRGVLFYSTPIGPFGGVEVGGDACACGLPRGRNGAEANHPVFSSVVSYWNPMYGTRGQL
jgi:hypothetical protein